MTLLALRSLMSPLVLATIIPWLSTVVDRLLGSQWWRSRRRRRRHKTSWHLGRLLLHLMVLGLLVLLWLMLMLMLL